MKGKIMNLKTILANGGATLTKDKKDAILHCGYMVSIPNLWTKVLTTDTDYATIEKAIDDMSKIVIPNASYVGVWVDTKQGLIYIDESFHYYDKGIALMLAKEKGEKAIYDIERGESIYL